MEPVARAPSGMLTRTLTPMPAPTLLKLAGTPAVHTVTTGAAQPLALLDAALLAWLALEGPTPRARLAQLLWPGKAVEAARNTLRQRLFQLRRAVGVPLLQGEHTLSLADGVAHDLDEADGVLGDAVAEDIAAGELAQWLEQQRTRRRERVRRSLVELSEMAEQAKDWDDALVHAGELLALEPLSEQTHRRVMRLHYLAGDRAAALLAFDRCERMLKDEVGARPSPETLALLATVEHSGTAAPPPAPRQPPASVLRPPRLVGRDAELAALRKGFGPDGSGHGGHVIALIGEAGLGKTRLLQTFIDSVPAVVRAAGRPGDAGVPLATLARLLRAVMAMEGAGASGPAALGTPIHGAAGAAYSAVTLPAATRSELARVLPELDAGAPRVAGEGQRLVLQRAVRALLAGRPGLAGLVVDDLHFADEASLDMLAALIDDEQAPPPTLRWILAYRPAEAASPVRALHDGLVEEARLLPITLQPLSVAALAELVDSLALPGVHGAALAPGLARRTGGNPLFVLETLKEAWVTQTLGELADAQAASPSVSLPRPLSVGRLIERRVAQLSPGALALARVASVAGVDFGIGLAEHVLGVSAMQFADALNELESAQVMRDTQFAHDLVFDAVRASVPPAIARHTHAGVAAWLEAHGGEPARIARHWVDAGTPVRALPWLGRAAASAGAAVRRKEQIAFLDEKGAIEAAAGDRATAFATLMEAAALQVTLDDGGAAVPALYDRLDALADTPAERVQVQVQRSNLATMRGELALAERCAAEALRDAVRHALPQALVVECREALATALGAQDRAPEAIAQFEAMLGWIEEHADDGRRCEFHGNLAMTYDSACRLADAAPHHEIAITLAAKIGHHGNLTLCLANAACNHVLGGHLAAGEALLARARLERTRDDAASSIDGFIALTQAICDYQGGRYRAALQSLDEGLERLTAFAPGYRPPALMHLAVCWAHLGQWARVQQVLDALGDLSTLPGGSRARAVLLRHDAQRARSGVVDGADAATQRTLALAAREAAEAHVIDIAHAVELERAALCAPAAALADCERVAAEAGALGHEGTVLAARAQAALAAARVGRADHADRAREHVRAFTTLAGKAAAVRQYPMAPWLAAAQALALLGEPAEATALCERAVTWIDETTRKHVPEPFRHGFVEHNPVNRQLRALHARLRG